MKYSHMFFAQNTCTCAYVVRLLFHPKVTYYYVVDTIICVYFSK